MTKFARMPARAAGHTRTTVLSSLLALLAVLVTCLLAAGPASAVVTEAEGVHVGLQPRSSSAPTEPAGSFGNESAAGRFRNEAGNVVVSGPTHVYFVYWDPGAWYHHEWVQQLDEFGQDLASSSGKPGTIFHALTQYRDRANAQASYDYEFEGAFSDTQPYPASGCSDPEPLELGDVACLTDAQLRAGLQAFVASKGTPKGMNSIYYLLTPPGVTVCLGASSGHCSDFEEGEPTSQANSFCSYHGAINPDSAAQGDANTVLYAAIPWVANYTGEVWDFRPAPGSSQAQKATECQDGVGNLEEPNQGHVKDEEGDEAASLQDVIVDQIAEEQANVTTDPLLTSWQNTSTGSEATDECRDAFGATSEPSVLTGVETNQPGTEAGTLSNETVGEHEYYINNVIDNGYLNHPRCMGGIGLIARFTAPTRANAGEGVTFDGMESTVSEFQGPVYGPSGPPSTTYANFTWDFGDGTTASGFAPGAPTCEVPWLSPCAASEIHTYTYGGTYPVTLTITDVAGNVTQVSREVTVVGPAPPAPAGSPGGAAPGSTSGSTVSTGSTGSTGANGANGSATPAVTPTAKAAVASHSLSTTLRKGLAVTYSVNEQVTGHFEVMIARSLAKKLKISGTPAKGLPAGTVPQLVIAKAVLVTTKGGHSTVHIQFSKKVAARLKHTHSAPLMLRLIVRNASSTNPETATVLSSVVLAG